MSRLMEIKQIDYELPPDTEEVKFVSFCSLPSVIRLEMKIKGILFKRISPIGGKKYKPVWGDPMGALGGAEILDDEKAADLEAIFNNYCIEMKINFEHLTKQKALK